MTEPLHIPLSDSDRTRLPAVVRAAWEGDRGAASVCGVDASRVTAHVSASGLLYLDGDSSSAAASSDARSAALSHLADDLALAGYAIARDGGVRVVGWAATHHHPTATPCACCGKSATCFGAYEGSEKPAFACDECCGHGNEDGWCGPFVELCSCPPPSIGDGPASCHTCEHKSWTESGTGLAVTDVLKKAQKDKKVA